MSNKKELKIGDKVKVVTPTALGIIEVLEKNLNFKCIYCLLEQIKPTARYPYYVWAINHKGMKVYELVFTRYELEKIEEDE